MRYDQILNELTPDADYTFATTTQPVTVKRGKNSVKVENEIVPILDSYDAIIWNDLGVTKPTSAECDTKWSAMAQAKADKEQLEAQRQADIKTGRATYPDRITDANAVTLLQLTERIIWLENELRDMRGL